ncbi:unnamed protein product [Effrenium voratum]|nr:unnamed protein product [Effrenium voratum]
MDRKEAWPQRSPATTFGEAVVRTAQAQGPDRDSLACMAVQCWWQEQAAATAFGQEVGEALSLQEVRSLVEEASQKLRLEAAGKKGRYLVAKCALKAGEVILSERPLFEGDVEAKRSRKVYSKAFLEKLNPRSPEDQDDAEDNDFEADCFHPRSPLMDCIASVLLCKQQVSASAEEERDKASLKLRQLGALCRSASKAEHRECVEDLWGALLPELQAATSQEELSCILQTLSSNRFGHGNHSIQLMFAGSMFEHSCLPNCFLGTWPSSTGKSTYRALRDIAEGEALSIDYLNFPAGYCPASARAQALAEWSFSCRCPRCQELPEVERSFLCPTCAQPELCPSRPGGSLQCLCCGQVPEAAYAARCLQREEELLRPGSESPAKAGIKSDEENLLGHRHHLVFQALWQDVEQGPPDEEEEPSAFPKILEALIDGISKVCREDLHPTLLNLYHMAAIATSDDLQAQKTFLEREHTILRRFYPEEAQRQDAEIMSLVQCNGPPKSATISLSELD